MGIEDSFLNQTNIVKAENKDLDNEKKETEERGLWEKTKERLEKFGLSFSDPEGEEKEAEIKDRIEEIENAVEKAEQVFLETEFEHDGKIVQYKAVAQKYEGYDPAYKIDYAKEDPNFQKEAERLLLREAVIGEKLAKYEAEASVSADKILESQTTAGLDMYFLKTGKESCREAGDFGYKEGRETARTLLLLQHKLPASEIVNEIKKERGYADTYELENEFFEDIFNDFEGYLENSAEKISDRVEDGLITSEEAKKIKSEMKKYRKLIESTQLKTDEYSLIYNQAGLDNMIVGEDGKIYLRNWSNVGTTQNRELALINDIGLVLESAEDSIQDDDQRREFMNGVKVELKEFYSKLYPTEGENNKGEKMAEAVIDLVRLRTGIAV